MPALPKFKKEVYKEILLYTTKYAQSSAINNLLHIKKFAKYVIEAFKHRNSLVNANAYKNILCVHRIVDLSYVLVNPSIDPLSFSCICLVYVILHLYVYMLLSR